MSHNTIDEAEDFIPLLEVSPEAQKKIEEQVAAQDGDASKYERKLAPWFPAGPNDPNPPLGSVNTLPAGEVKRSDPALRFCTREFWELLEERGKSQWHPDHSDPASMLRFDWKVDRVPASVTLYELAEAMGIRPQYARPYLRAIYTRLAALGVLLRERRLAADFDLESTPDRYLGTFVTKEVRAERFHAVGDAKRALKAALEKAKESGSKDDWERVSEAKAALAVAEAAVSEMQKSASYLAHERQGFAVFIDTDTYIPIHQEDGETVPSRAVVRDFRAEFEQATADSNTNDNNNK